MVIFRVIEENVRSTVFSFRKSRICTKIRPLRPEEKGEASDFAGSVGTAY